MAVLKLTDQVGGGGAGGRDARPRGGAEPGGGMEARRCARPRAVYSRRRGGVLAAAGCSESRRLRLSSPGAVPALGRRNCGLGLGKGLAGARRSPGSAPRLCAGVCVVGGPGWAGGGEARGAPPALSVLRSVGSPPGARRGAARARRREGGSGWRGIKDRSLGPFPKTSRRPAQTEALVWSAAFIRLT